MIGWLTYAFACGIDVLACLLPGFAFLLLLGLKPISAFSGAAPVSVAIVCAMGVLLHALGFVGVIWLSIAVTLFSIAMLALAAFARLRKTKKGDHERQKPDHIVPRDTFIILVGCMIAMAILFVYNLDGPSSYIQFADNMTHLSMIQAMLAGGSTSTIALSNYEGVVSSAQAAYTGSSYYPAGFHIMATLGTWLIQPGAPLAENAMIYVASGILYPLGVAGLLQELFGENRRAARLGAVVACAGVAFPLRLITVHGPFPQLFAYTLIPSIIFLFIRSFDFDRSCINLRCFSAALIALAGAVFSHPNSAFTFALFISPFIMLRVIPELVKSRTAADKSFIASIVIGELIFAALFIIVWAFFLNASFMQSIVGHTWYFLYSPAGTMHLILDFATGIGVAQPAMALVVAVGFIRALLNTRARWASITYFVICLQYYLGMATNYELKRIMIGFWYTDPERIISMIALAAVPLAAYGIDAVICGLEKLRSKFGINDNNSARAMLPSAIVVILFVAINYYPFVPTGTPFPAAFDISLYQLERDNKMGPEQGYTYEERAFVQKVRDLVGPDEMLINLPYDGSSLAGAADDLTVYYRAQGGGTVESDSSETIRLRLDQIADDPSVQDAVEAVGAQYVLMLDRSDYEIDSRDEYGNTYMQGNNCLFVLEEWEGLMLDDSTPGFETVLAEGDMRLYRIDDDFLDNAA